MKTILGFDISSSTIGYCILKLDENIGTITFIKADYLKPIKKGSIVERIVDTRNKIQKIIDQEDPDCIGIEDIIQFMKGKSTAKTIIMLTTFNRMICLLAQDFLQTKNNTSPELFSVMSIRHGLKIDKIFPKKEDMPELVAKHLGITFPYEQGKKGKIKIENYDKADGIAVALYYAFLMTGKAKRKGKVKIK
jgi:Holliday junction resolvasome RuvABC endonuclease subunit